MTANPLLKHPFWKQYDPSFARLVRVSNPFPPELNPFAKDGVVIRAAGIPGEAVHSKWIVAREGILHGVREGRITPGTRVIEATSGNTGDGMAKVCNAIGVPFTAVMSHDVPQDKINAIRVVGRRTEVQLHSSTTESTVEFARRIGKEEGWYNPDQYAGDWNPKAHASYLAPELWEQAPDISLLFVPSGTMGTSVGLARYASHRGRGTVVIPVLCTEGEEVPGARTLSSVKRDVQQPYQEYFPEEVFEFGMRHESFYFSFLTWSHVIPNLGPSFGLGMSGALRFLLKHQSLRTLDQFKKPDGTIQVVIVGPDDCRPYYPLYFGELKTHEMSLIEVPKKLLSILEKP